MIQHVVRAFIAVTLVSAPAARAEEPTRPGFRVTAMRIAEESGATAARPGIAFQQSRDPLRNGIVIGAIVGAAATFGFGMYLCEALKEEGDPACLPPALVLGAAGAGAGALIGAGIDALAVRGPGIRVIVRF